jgi:6-methylsalicylate decarboxylase
LIARKIGEVPVLRWNLQAMLDDMDRSEVSTSILSITWPGVNLGEIAEARSLARACNEYAAKLMSDHPGRFGSFAAMPMPDVDATLREIEYSLDVLKADGICFLTSFYDEGVDRWLGDPRYAPILAELNRRKAVVYTHPTAANCCKNLLPYFNPSVVEFTADTTRTIASIVFSGSAARYPDIRWIFSHGGGTMPFIVERFTRAPLLNPKLKEAIPNGVEAELRKFYYDVAQAAHPTAMAAMRQLIPMSQVLYGTDYPFRLNGDYVKALAEHGFSAAELAAINRGNALRLLPRLAG